LPARCRARLLRDLVQLAHLRPLTRFHLNPHQHMALADLPDLEKVGKRARELLQVQRTGAGLVAPRAIFSQQIPYVGGSRLDGDQTRDGECFGLTHPLGFVFFRASLRTLVAGSCVAFSVCGSSSARRSPLAGCVR
jgi:hypothetical protein